jgi:uncharacterized membrane protein
MAGKKEEKDNLLEKVILAACIVALVVTVALLLFRKEEPYSVIYLKSYYNYFKDNVSFSYVVESHENKPSSYSVEVWLSNSTVKNDSFQIDSGSIERSVTFPVSNQTQFPAKVEVIAKVGTRNYSVHFWLWGIQSD